MVLQISDRTVHVGFVKMEQTQTLEETILFLLLMILGVLAVLLTFAYMVYGEVEE